jgi:RNA polymerase sigma-70 factor (ECF subfamily)
MDLPLTAPLLGQERQRALKLEEQILKLYDELREPVYRYLLCQGVNPADADDITQETFLRLFQHLHAGGRENNLRGWVFRVAHNLAINEYKSRKFLSLLSPEQWAELNDSKPEPAPNPEELLLQKEKMARLHATMSTLSAQQHQCLYLRAEGFRYREIAEILGVTVSTVAESVRRAIGKLTGGIDD